MKKLLKLALPLCFGGLLSLELVLLGDVVVVWLGGMTSLSMALGVWLVLTIGLGFLLRWNGKRLGLLACAVPLILGILWTGASVSWRSFSRSAAYAFDDSGKAELYADRRVMVIVPHQDDDLNVLGGVLEEYVRYGSILYPVFVTNGDFEGLADTRNREVLEVFDHLGVPEEQIVFLGYADGWNNPFHLYNEQPGVVVESHIGRTATYGLPEHPAYREGHPYTSDNMIADMKDLILEIRPEVIFCSDYDRHNIHKGVTLLFEKVMGQILKENPDYRPVVYKAYAYGTAWDAELDYYADNVLSTKNLYEEPYSQRPVIYHWEDRVRFPVRGDTLSRSLIASAGYQLMAKYRSQEAEHMAAAVLNGDKVAWRRYTDSLCLGADVTVSSGDGSRLHDFMLVDSKDLINSGKEPREQKPYDGVWTPMDEEKTAAVTLEKPSDLAVLALYDHPDPEQNVLNAVITFDDGDSVETGPLDPNGAVTWVQTDKKNVASFTVTLTAVEGEQAGLSELEAFSEMPRQEGRFIKLMDGEGNFLYDYLMPAAGTAELSLYSYGDLPELNEEDYLVSISEGGTAVLEDGVIWVTCPAGEVLTLEVSCRGTAISDRIVIRNPGMLERCWNDLWQDVDAMLFDWNRRNLQFNLLIATTMEKVSYLLRHL